MTPTGWSSTYIESANSTAKFISCVEKIIVLFSFVSDFVGVIVDPKLKNPDETGLVHHYQVVLLEI